MNKLIIIFIFFSLISNAQSKKELKENNIKRVTTYNYITKFGKVYKLIDNYKEYNNKGYITKEVEYNKEGKLKYIKKIYYNENNKKIKEELFDRNKKIEKVTTYEYENNLKISKKVTDGKGAIISKKKYEYLKFESN